MRGPHCTACGADTGLRDARTHRSCRCGHTDYANPAPAAGVAILRDGCVLLSRRARPPKPNEWDLVGGFIEPDEGADDAARREVKEETGLDLNQLRLHRVVPGDYAGLPTLNLLYTAQATGDPVPDDDSAELRFTPLDALPPLAWPHEAAFLADLAADPAFAPR